MKRAAILLTLLSGLLAAPVLAQGTGIAFGGLGLEAGDPVEILADRLDVDQATGSATFAGNVVIAQGEMRLSAGKVEIEYGSAEGDAPAGLARLKASDGVTLVSQTEAAEGREAVYDLEAGTIVITGDVLLTQGRNTISGDKLTVNLAAGTGVVEGRVRTVFQAGNN